MHRSNTSSGTGFFSILFLLFLGLKLGGYIRWSWWWVTCPLWGPAAVMISAVATFCGGAAIVFIVLLAFEMLNERKRR